MGDVGEAAPVARLTAEDTKTVGRVDFAELDFNAVGGVATGGKSVELSTAGLVLLLLNKAELAESKAFKVGAQPVLSPVQQAQVDQGPD